MNKKLGYFFIFGVVINIVLLVKEFIKVSERNSPIVEYIQLGPYALILLCLFIAIAYAFGILPSKNDGS